MASTLSRRSTLALLPAIVRLAWWRLRQMWRSLLVTWLGMIAMVVLICSVPLFAQVSSTIGLRSVLSSIPLSQQRVNATFYSLHPTSDQILQAQQQINQAVQSNIGFYVNGSADFSVSLPPLTLQSSASQGASSQNTNTLQVVGYDLDKVGSELTVVQGHLPDALNNQIEIALTQAEAASLHASIGSVLKATFPDSVGSVTWTLHVVGIFGTSKNWEYANDFQANTSSHGTSYPVLASSSALLPQLSSLQVSLNNQQVFGNKGVVIAAGGKGSPNLPFFGLNWSYPLDITRVNTNNMDALVQGGTNLSSQLGQSLQQVPDAAPFQMRSAGPLFDTISNYETEIAIANIPIIALLVLILALLIFLVSTMSVALVERQTATIATLRSRGATRRHVFGAFVTQGTILGLIALILGPFAAILLVELLVHLLLSGSPQSSLNVLLDNPFSTALSVGWFALATIACALLTLIISVRRATQMDVLAFRRESSRSTRAPFWRRLNLDIVGVVLLCLGYLGYLYMSQPTIAGQLGKGLLVIRGVMALCAPFLASAICFTLFLRLFPLCLRLCTFLSSRRRKAPAVLAFAQMARAPRPASRMILLLLLVISTTMFALVYTATQQQRTSDSVDFAIGADFSGSVGPNTQHLTLAQETATYTKVQGVTSATLGYEDSVQQTSALTDVVAVNADTYASTVIWSSQHSEQSLASLMSLLISHRADATNNDTVYTIIDDEMASNQHLSVGSSFILPTSDGYSIHYVVAGIVHYIPSVYDSSSDLITYGMLCDYQSYASVYRQNSGSTLDPNFVWLKTNSDSTSLSSVRAAFPNLQDLRAQLASAESNPLYVNVDGMLYLGIATALLLALLGTLFFSWLNASGRLTNFAVLRALGMPPRQIAAVLLWEQGWIYVFAVVLGLGLGLFLMTFVGPALIFTDVVTALSSKASIYTLPVQLVVPAWLIIGLLGALVVICGVALALMARLVSRPSMSQTLRLNED
ncbi:hypothetical protein KSD_02940 [Ktedonobacter sp. SOSP1-85]|uniref:FtsX-like permease family protein n=1 Tax=Ktedonobacter sp. SOSP1-85 TaxID=2778367 RepID=UPI001915AE20|nr:FtsX-like permease family protein [Ktedonobacter sp. SOSP1-85]GHO72523.1 hypothetical protein KSD_02940 [Ktedonobacter sp. SOSP1-85]